MKMQPSVIVKKLFMEGVMVTVNQEIDFEKAEEIALAVTFDYGSNHNKREAECAARHCQQLGIEHW